MKLRHQVGQLIIAGVEGAELTALERTWLNLVRPAGVILFRRNIERAAQVLELLRSTSRIGEDPLLRCVDLEGGLVDRLRDLIAPMPSPAAVFTTGKRTNFIKHGKLIGSEAKALGFNVTFAPVLDLGLPVSATVMRTRVVSPDPEGVTAYANAFLDGLDQTGVLGCGKHFPGLGGGTLDSHQAMPLILRTRKELWQQDLFVFRALAPRLPMIMVAHANYPRIKNTPPASLSRHWITSVLKKRIGFGGLIISDDMEMGGVLTQASMEEAAVQAIAAGTDLIEICKDPALVLRAYEALLAEAERSAAFRKRVEETSAKVGRFKRRYLNASIPRSVSADQIEKLRREVKKFSAEVGE